MWPELVSNPGPLALETDCGMRLTRLVAAGMGGGRGVGQR